MTACSSPGLFLLICPPFTAISCRLFRIILPKSVPLRVQFPEFPVSRFTLITTVGGLIVAMILQVFYNYILAKIDSLAIDMEDSSIRFVDTLTKAEAKK